MGIEEESLRELKSLNQNIASLTRSLGKVGSGSFGTPQSGARDGRRDDYDPNKKLRRGTKEYERVERATKGYDAAAKKFMSVSGKLSSNIADASDDLKVLRQSWQEGSEAMFDMKERIDKWGDSQTAMNSQTARIVASMSRFTNYLAKTTKAQSLLYAEQLTFINKFKDFEKAAYFDELTRSVGALSATAKKRMKLVDSATGAMRADLDVSDFKRVRTTIGEIESSIKEVLSGTDFKSFAEMVDNGRFNESAGDGRSSVDATGAAMGVDKSSINREAVAKIAAMLQAKGMFEPQHENQNVLDQHGNLKNAAELNKIDWQGLAKSISLTEQSFGRASQQLDKNVDIFNDRWGRLLQSLKNNEGRAAAIDSMRSMVAGFLSSTAAFKIAKDKIVKAYEEIQDFNIAQIPATYFEVNKASIDLGLSFKDTVKLMDENKRVLAIYGPQKFTSAMSDMSKSFRKYGYTMEQAADMVGPTVESAISAGINIRDPGQLNSFADNMMNQFQKVSGMVKISAQEFAHLNKQLFTSEGTFDTMLGMDVQRRQAYAQDLVQLRTKYVAQGLEIQQAQELVKAQQEQQRGRLKDRNEDAAKLMTAAQVAGLGSDAAMEAFRLATKGRRTADEDARLTELAGQINQGIETATNQGYGASGTGAMGDILNDLRLDLQPSGAMSQMQKAGSQIQVAKEAGAQVNPDEQKRASDAAKGNESVAQLGQAVNKVSAVINNAFLGSIVASSVALVAFGYQLTKVSALMGGPKGIVSTITDIAKGFLGKGKLPGTGGTVAGAAEGAATGAAAGAAEGAATGGIRGAASRVLGAGGGVLGKVAGIAGVGLMGASAFSDMSDIEDQKKSGQISNKQANVKSAGVVGGLAAGGTAGLIGAGIGQVLIPIPGVGAVVGGAVGAALGGWLGKTGSEAIANAVISDDTASPAKQAAKQTVSQPAQTADASSVPAQPVKKTGATAVGTVAQIATPVSGMPVAPAMPKIGVDSAKDTSDAGINTDDPTKMLVVKDEDALAQLQAIAQNMAQAVQFLQQLANNQPKLQVGVPTAVAAPSLPMNSIPSAYEFATGRKSI